MGHFCKKKLSLGNVIANLKCKTLKIRYRYRVHPHLFGIIFRRQCHRPKRRDRSPRRRRCRKSRIYPDLASQQPTRLERKELGR